MPTAIDILLVALFSIAGPLIDYYFAWPLFQRKLKDDPARARSWAWTATIASEWVMIALVAALWLYHGRPWTSLGFTLPEGWRLWVSIGLVIGLAAQQVLSILQVRKDPALRERLRGQADQLADFLPHTLGEARHFGAVSLTAGFCEETWYRGFFIWVLAPWLGWWGAAALSIPVFGFAHAYQGRQGVLRTAIVGALFVALFALLGSLWPGIVLHAMLDLGNGILVWLALREAPANAAPAGST